MAIIVQQLKSLVNTGKRYAINDALFHWQSQSTISGNSPTGTRYINHKSEGSKILLFVREFNKGLARTAPYTFLGLANYVSHTGSKPMSVTWKLHRPIPAKYLRKQISLWLDKHIGKKFYLNI